MRAVGSQCFRLATTAGSRWHYSGCVQLAASASGWPQPLDHAGIIQDACSWQPVLQVGHNRWITLALFRMRAVGSQCFRLATTAGSRWHYSGCVQLAASASGWPQPLDHAGIIQDACSWQPVLQVGHNRWITLALFRMRAVGSQCFRLATTAGSRWHYSGCVQLAASASGWPQPLDHAGIIQDACSWQPVLQVGHNRWITLALFRMRAVGSQCFRLATTAGSRWHYSGCVQLAASASGWPQPLDHAGIIQDACSWQPVLQVGHNRWITLALFRMRAVGSQCFRLATTAGSRWHYSGCVQLAASASGWPQPLDHAGIIQDACSWQPVLQVGHNRWITLALFRMRAVGSQCFRLATTAGSRWHYSGCVQLAASASGWPQPLDHAGIIQDACSWQPVLQVGHNRWITLALFRMRAVGSQCFRLATTAGSRWHYLMRAVGSQCFRLATTAGSRWHYSGCVQLAASASGWPQPLDHAGIIQDACSWQPVLQVGHNRWITLALFRMRAVGSQCFRLATTAGSRWHYSGCVQLAASASGWPQPLDHAGIIQDACSWQPVLQVGHNRWITLALFRMRAVGSQCFRLATTAGSRWHYSGCVQLAASASGWPQPLDHAGIIQDACSWQPVLQVGHNRWITLALFRMRAVGSQCFRLATTAGSRWHYSGCVQLAASASGWPQPLDHAGVIQDACSWQPVLQVGHNRWITLALFRMRAVGSQCFRLATTAGSRWHYSGCVQLAASASGWPQPLDHAGIIQDACSWQPVLQVGHNRWITLALFRMRAVGSQCFRLATTAGSRWHYSGCVQLAASASGWPQPLDHAGIIQDACSWQPVLQVGHNRWITLALFRMRAVGSQCFRLATTAGSRWHYSGCVQLAASASGWPQPLDHAGIIQGEGWKRELLDMVKHIRARNDLMGEASTYVTMMERCGYREGIGLTVVAILRDVFSTWHYFLENRTRSSLKIVSTCYELGLKSLGASGSTIISKLLRKGMDYAEVDTEVCLRLHALFTDALKWAEELDELRIRRIVQLYLERLAWIIQGLDYNCAEIALNIVAAGRHRQYLHQPTRCRCTLITCVLTSPRRLRAGCCVSFPK